MLTRIIDWALANRLIVTLLTLGFVIAGVAALRATPLEALPDLSDIQVIVQAEYGEQAPRIVEDQVTYPIAAEMLKVPGARTVRGYSFFGVSFVYVIFEDDIDLYWARSRVLEYLNGLTGRLPASVTPTLGPDATGLPIRAGGHHRPDEPRRTAGVARLDPAVCTDRRSGRLRGGYDRRV